MLFTIEQLNKKVLKKLKKPSYVEVVDLFASKTYLYPMKNRKLIPLKLQKFYKDVENNRKHKKARFQTDFEFKKKKIFDLNRKYNIKMFSTAVRGGKAFTAEKG